MITPFGRDIAALSYSWMFHLTTELASSPKVIKNKLYTDEIKRNNIFMHSKLNKICNL